MTILACCAADICVGYSRARWIALSGCRMGADGRRITHNQMSFDATDVESFWSGY